MWLFPAELALEKIFETMFLWFSSTYFALLAAYWNKSAIVYSTRGLFTWREGVPAANRATRLTELLGEG